MNFTNIINEFVDKMGYLQNEYLEGIVFYGSSQTGFYNQFSDIDLHIIFSKLNQEIRGSMMIDNHRIEYFEKTLKTMYNKADYEFSHQSNVLVSMLVYGNVIIDTKGNIALLQDYIKTLYSQIMPPMEIEKAKEQIAIINNFLDDLNSMIATNNIYAIHTYHLTLERIKDLYYSTHALPGVARTKTLKVMLDKDYRNAIKKENPDDEFISLYLMALDENIPISNRVSILLKLLNLSKNNIEFDNNNHRIVLKKQF